MTKKEEKSTFLTVYLKIEAPITNREDASEAIETIDMCYDELNRIAFVEVLHESFVQRNMGDKLSKSKEPTEATKAPAAGEGASTLTPSPTATPPNPDVKEPNPSNPEDIIMADPGTGTALMLVEDEERLIKL